MSRVTVTEQNAVVQVDSDTNEVVVSAFGPQGPSIGVAPLDEGDGITITGSAPQVVALTPGSKARVPMLWDGDSWQNKPAEHSRIVSAHTDDHHRYVDREISVSNRNVIQPQADVTALELRELSGTANSPLQVWAAADGTEYANFSRTGLSMFGTISFNDTGVTFNGLIDGLPHSSGYIWIGNAFNVAQERLVSGDATLSNTGVLTLANSGVVAGTYPKVTVDAKGRVTAGTTLSSGDLPSHNHAASDITSGTVSTARLGSGTANSTTFLRGDNTWASPPAGFTNPMTSVGDLIVGGSAGAANRLALGTANQLLKSNGTTAAWGTVAHSELTGLTTGNPHTQYLSNVLVSGSTQNIISPELGNHVNALVVQQSDDSTYPGLGTDEPYFGVWKYGGVTPAWMLFNTDGAFTQIKQSVPTHMLAGSTIKLFNSGNTRSVTLQVASGLAADPTFQFPSTNGTNGQVLTTNGSGVTSWTTVSSGFANPMTTNGDLITQSGGSPARLGIGASGTFLQSNGSAASWNALAVADLPSLTSTQLATLLSDETGSGSAVFGTSPTISAPSISGGTHTALTSLGIRSTGAAFDLTLASSEALTAGRTLSINVGDAARTLTISGNATISGTNTGDQTSVTGNAGTATALQTARNINGVAFNGTADITVAAAAGTLTGSTLAAGVTGSSLTSLGTIGTGVWQGTTIGLAYGGTNANLSATGGTGHVLKQSTVGGAVSVGTLGHSELTGLASGNSHTQYVWNAPIDGSTQNVINPGLGNHRDVLVIQQGDSSTFPGTATDDPYFGVWKDGGTVPAWMLFCNDGAFQQVRQSVPLRIYNSAGTFYSEVSIGTLSGNTTFRLPTSNGSASQFLQTNGSGVTSWASLVAADIPNLAASKITSGTLAIAQGGTGQATANAGYAALSPMTTNGDLVTRAGGVPVRLGVGTEGQSLRVVSGAPAWASSAGQRTNTQITSNQNDYAIDSSDVTGLVLVSADANGRTITGITGGVGGRVVRLLNNGTTDIIFTHQDTASTAANRFVLPFELDMVLRPGDCWTLIYDSTNSRWRLLDGFEGYLNDPAFITDQFDDFSHGTNGNGTFGTQGWSLNNNGGTVTHSTNESGRYGVVQIGSGTTSSGRGEVVSNNPTNVHILGNQVFEAIVRTPTLAAAGVTDYSVIVGWSNSMAANGGSGDTHQIAFVYNRSLSTNWATVTAGASQTRNDSGVAAATTWTRLRCVLNTALNNAKFYINDALVATHTTNFPSSGPYAFKMGIWNSADASHTSMPLQVDAWRLRILRTTRR